MAIKKKKVVLSSRDRKKIRIRRKIRGTDERPRISVFRSGKHIYAQVISDQTEKTLVSASTLEKGVVDKVSKVDELSINDAKSSKSIAAAYTVGGIIAERLKEKGIQRVVFDRSGYLYHGRIKALAEGARAGGLEF